jgi:chromosome segregation ATPase
MIVRRVAIVLGLVAFVLPAVSVAQGLGDVAARERAKREAAKKASDAKVITNDDLDKARPPGSASPSGTSVSGREERPAEDSSPPPIEDRLANERPYLDALQAAKTRVSQIEQKIQNLRSKLNPMSGSFIYGATGSNSAEEEAQVREQLTQAEAELNEARQTVVAANQALQDHKQGRPSAPPVVQ